jgi:GAF domain-containing protein
LLYDGERFHAAHLHDVPPGYRRFWEQYGPITPSPNTGLGRLALTKQVAHIPDLKADPAYAQREPLRVVTVEEAGARTFLSVPLLKDNELIGAIVIYRQEVWPFAENQIDLIKTFADQAVIAIENARLFNEVQAKTRDLEEALRYQTGSADILNVIASSPTDVKPVLKAIVESACELCGAYDAVVRIKDVDGLAFGAHHGPLPVSLESVPITKNSTAGMAVIGRKPVHVHDLLAADGDRFPHAQELARMHGGERTILSVPLLREGEGVGAIVLRRTEIHPFSDKQIALLQTFADQAVIAIQNVKMFDEVQAKTRDLTEALTYQTGSANILNVIASSPTDVEPVLEAIVKSACELCDAYDALVRLRNGDELEFSAHHGSIQASTKKLSIDRNSAAGLAVIDRRPVHVHDLLSPEGDAFPGSQEHARRFGHHTILCIPLLREGECIGVIVLRRMEVNPFSDKQIALLQTFADQAVIAIENARLFDEVQFKTHDLQESLQFQTASGEVLKVISQSPDALQPVFDVVVETARELCRAQAATIFTLREGRFHVAAFAGVQTELLQHMKDHPISLEQKGSALARSARERRTIHIPNTAEDPEFAEGGIIGMGEPRSTLTVPLMRDGKVIGSITLRQSHLRPFTARQIEAIETFADQAVIAISNVGLFDQVQARTIELTESLEQQTATSEVLQVISSSQGKLEPVFQKMLEKATHVCGANFGTMNLWDGESVNIAASYNVPPAFAAWRQRTPIRPHPESGLAIVIRTHRVVHVHDLRCGPAYLARDPANVAMVEIAGARTIVTVPMLKADKLIGTMSIFRQEVRPFTDKQIALVENFTKQAVIAIENTRLLNELRERTNELSQSLDELRAAQDRLIQTEKLASLGQLTAGIAHEIKNPLNFVNNFSALSTELVDEMNDVLKGTALDQKPREELEELAQILKSNLEKVVQHGRRADSIVKNMLLHSRQGSGEHRSAAVNAIVEESLNLAYHGARAEKSGFKITLQRDLDPGAGVVEVYPQEITRALLNLISNGFYAATKRKSEASDETFEPVLSAATKNLGNRVEIRIRDNGVGMSPDVKEKMFNPFFTTKPAGEGTGLGLSISHDIIVKQHSGTIDVDTEPGVFTEFIITLPRNAAAPIQTGNRNDR